MKSLEEASERATFSQQKVNLKGQLSAGLCFYFLQTADVDQIFDILQLHYQNSVSASHRIGGAWKKRDLEIELDYGFGLGLFDVDFKLIGFILYRKIDIGVDISILATHPDHLGCGVMWLLLKELARVVPFPGQMRLEVHEENSPAIQLYKNFGFRFLRRRPQYYRDGKSALVFVYGAG